MELPGTFAGVAILQSNIFLLKNRVTVLNTHFKLNGVKEKKTEKVCQLLFQKRKLSTYQPVIDMQKDNVYLYISIGTSVL